MVKTEMTVVETQEKQFPMAKFKMRNEKKNSLCVKEILFSVRFSTSVSLYSSDDNDNVHEVFKNATAQKASS